MSISLRAAMDAAPVGRLQWSIAVLLTCVFVLEGIDFQVAAYCGPSLMALWHLGKLQFAPLLAAAMIGMAVGTLIGSWTGDRYGRKPTLVASVVFFGVMTMICGSATGPREFMAYRFISGLGFGAAFPVAIAQMGEWMPRRVAGKAVSIMTIGIPAGVILGAAIASWFLPSFGWRPFFVVIGAICVAFSVLLAVVIPESPSYLVLRGRHRQVHSLLSRAWRHSALDGALPFHLEQRVENIEGLFGRGHTRLNIGLWIGFLASSLATYTMAAWLTIVLKELGLPLTTALRGPIIYSSSAILGALAIGWLIARLGSRTAMLLLAVAGIASAVAMAMAIEALPIGPSLFAVLFPGLAIDGFCIGALIPANLVLATRAYETQIRSRGIGVMSAIGRAGSVLSSFLGGAVLAFASGGGFFLLIGGLVMIVALGAIIVDQHTTRAANRTHKGAAGGGGPLKSIRDAA